MGYATKRKLAVYGTLFLIFLIFAYWFYDAKIKERPTCFDGIRNGFEEGVDCGGTCEEICVFKAEKININWTRAFEVSNGVYNIASSIENPNFNYGFQVDYTIKYFNDRNINMGEINNTIHLDPIEKEIVFFPGIQLKGQKIKKVFLVQNRIYNLEKKKEEERKISINSKEIVKEKDFTKLKVTIQNDDFLPQRSIRISAVIFDKDKNVIDINRTYVDYLDKEERRTVYMTWPKEFKEEIAEIKIYLNQSKI